MSAPGGMNLTTLWVNVAPSMSGVASEMAKGGQVAASEFGGSFQKDVMKYLEPVAKAWETSFGAAIKVTESALDDMFKGKAPDMGEFTGFFQMMEGGIASVAEKAVGWIPIFGDIAKQFIGTWSESFQEVTGLAGELLSELQNMGNEWQEMGRQIQGATGASEEGLKNYLDVTQRILSSGDIVHLKDVADAIGIIGDRIKGINNDQLEQFTTLVATSEELIGQVNVTQLTGALSEWGVSAEDVTNKYAGLVHAVEDSKMPMDSLTRQLIQLGPVLQSFGLDVDQAVNFVTALNKQQIDPSRLAYTFQRAAKDLIDSGQDMNGALESIFQQADNLIKAGQPQDAAKFLQNLFGPYGAQKMLDAVRQQSESLVQLFGVAHKGLNENAQDVIDQVERTATLGDQMEAIKNRVMGDLRGLSEGFSTSLTDAGKSLSAWFEEHHTKILEFSKGVFEAMGTGVQWIINMTADGLGIIAPWLNLIRSMVTQLSAGILGIIGVVSKVGSILPDAFGGAAFKDVADHIPALIEQLGKLNDVDFTGPTEKFIQGMHNVADALPGYVDHITEGMNPLLDLNKNLDGLREHLIELPDQKTFKFDGDTKAIQEGLNKVGLTFDTVDNKQDGAVTKIHATTEKIKAAFEDWYKSVTGKTVNIDLVVKPVDANGNPIDGVEQVIPAQTAPIPIAPVAAPVPKMFQSSGGPTSFTPAIVTGSPPGGANQDWVAQQLAANGLSPDAVKAALALNQVEGGATNPQSILGFTDETGHGQAGAYGGGPQGHIAAFMNQWRTRGNSGQMPGMSPEGTVTDWNQFMSSIMTMIGQSGTSSDFHGDAQPTTGDYHNRLMTALGQVAAPTAGAPAGPVPVTVVSPGGAPILVPAQVPGAAMPTVNVATPPVPGVPLPVISPIPAGTPSPATVIPAPSVVPAAPVGTPPVAPPAAVPVRTQGWQPAQDGWKYAADNNGATFWLPPNMPDPGLNPQGAPNNVGDWTPTGPSSRHYVPHIINHGLPSFIPHGDNAASAAPQPMKHYELPPRRGGPTATNTAGLASQPTRAPGTPDSNWWALGEPSLPRSSLEGVHGLSEHGWTTGFTMPAVGDPGIGPIKEPTPSGGMAVPNRRGVGEMAPDKRTGLARLWETLQGVGTWVDQNISTTEMDPNVAKEPWHPPVPEGVGANMGSDYDIPWYLRRHATGGLVGFATGGEIPEGGVWGDPNSTLDGGKGGRHRYIRWGGNDGLPRVAGPGDPISAPPLNKDGDLPNIWGIYPGVPGVQNPSHPNFPTPTDPIEIWAKNRRGVKGFQGGGQVDGDWLTDQLLAHGLSGDEAKGILAMNVVEGGTTDPKSILGFTERQAKGPEGHLRAFFKQWDDMGRRPAGGGIPGVAANGRVTDWDAYMTWIRVKILNQTGVAVDFEGGHQPPASDYQGRLMGALGQFATGGNFDGHLPYGGHSGKDSMMIGVEPYEFVVKRAVAEKNLAKLWHLNEVGHWPGDFSGKKMQGGGPTNDDAGVDPQLLYVEQFANQIGLYMTAGKSGHGTHDIDKKFHDYGEAGDFGNGIQTPEELSFATYMFEHFGGQLAELIYDDPRMPQLIKDGQAVDPGFYGSALGDHKNHVHVAIRATQALSDQKSPGTELVPGGAPATAMSGPGGPSAPGGGSGSVFNQAMAGATPQNTASGGYVTDPITGQKVREAGPEYYKSILDNAKRLQAISDMQVDVNTASAKLVADQADIVGLTAARDKALADWQTAVATLNTQMKDKGGWDPSKPLPPGADTDAYKGFVDALDKASDALTAGNKTVSTDAEGARGKQEKLDEKKAEPPDRPKGAKDKPDKLATDLGGGLVSGMLQELGLDGSVFEDFRQWGIWKLFTGGVNYLGGLAKASNAESGGPASGGGTGSTLGDVSMGAATSIIPGINQFMQPPQVAAPASDVPGAMNPAPAGPLPGPGGDSIGTQNNYHITGTAPVPSDKQTDLHLASQRDGAATVSNQPIVTTGN